MHKILAKLLSKHNITHIPVHNPRDALAYLSNPHNPRPNFIFLKVFPFPHPYIAKINAEKKDRCKSP